MWRGSWAGLKLFRYLDKACSFQKALFTSFKFFWVSASEYWKIFFRYGIGPICDSNWSVLKKHEILKILKISYRFFVHFGGWFLSQVLKLNSEKMCFFSFRFWIWILENSFLISNWNSALLIGAPWIRVWLITPTAPLLESLIHAWRENQYNYEATIRFFLLFCWFNLWLGKSLCYTIWIFSLLERSCHIVPCFIRFGMQAQRMRREKAKKAQEASQEAGHEAGKILRQ